MESLAPLLYQGHLVEQGPRVVVVAPRASELGEDQTHPTIRAFDESTRVLIAAMPVPARQ